MPSYFAPDLKPESKLVVLDENESHHLINVLRKKPGATVSLTSGNGILAEAVLKKINQQKKVELNIKHIQNLPGKIPAIAVGFALLKNKHDLMIVEKCTELGVKFFFPFVSERSVKKGSSATPEKYRKVAIAAIKQCNNAYLPKISSIDCLTECLKKIKQNNYLPLYASETEKNLNLSGCLKVLEPEIKKKNICIMIGPEGGFTENENKLFKKEKIFPFTLGNHILRAETAAISSVSVLKNLILNFDKNYY